MGMAEVATIELPEEWADQEKVWTLSFDTTSGTARVPFSHARVDGADPTEWRWEDDARVHHADGQPEPDGRGGWTWVSGETRYTVNAEPLEPIPA